MKMLISMMLKKLIFQTGLEIKLKKIKNKINENVDFNDAKEVTILDRVGNKNTEEVNVKNILIDPAPEG